MQNPKQRNQIRWPREPKSSRQRVQGRGQGQPPGVKEGLMETRWESPAGAGEAPTQPSWGREWEHRGHCPASICTLSSGELPLAHCAQCQQGLSLLSRVLEGQRKHMLAHGDTSLFLMSQSQSCASSHLTQRLLLPLFPQLSVCLSSPKSVSLACNQRTLNRYNCICLDNISLLCQI